jgi:tetratricopeptide (TPR) repeat protein
MNAAVEEGGTNRAREALRRGRPDEAAALLDGLLVSGMDLGEAVPLLAQVLRDNARDARLLQAALAALSIDPADCGSYDHLEHRFRRRIINDNVFDEIAGLAFSRPEASPYSLAVVDDLLAIGRIEDAEAQLRKMAPVTYGTPLNALQTHAAASERRLHPYIGIWNYLRGKIALARGDLEGALAALTASVQSDPQLYSARALAGQICRRLGMGAKACALFDLVPMLDTDVYTSW